ncbi:J domain-containing protein [Haloplanus sp. GCM10025708]|uniref:J domain-containing protein n=1 Tax=Haloferacaceae TaxID=1644056 RepID=UPI00361DBDF9
MPADWLSHLPPWLVVGLAVGTVASVAVAGLFLVAGRLFPGPQTERGPRVDGVARRRAEIRAYLLGVGERFVEDREVHGNPVDFYLPERDVAITFDPRAYFRIERAGTYAVLCEHEMPASQLGRRLPFDVPERAARVDADDPITAAFRALGLRRSAGVDEVKAAYRAKVKDVHPDHGGDQESFRRLREAYTTAKKHAG